LTLNTASAVIGNYEMSFLAFSSSSGGGDPINGSAFRVPTYTISAAPEPSSIALVACVALGGYVIRRRRRSASE
jgi:hypothetical protein